MYQKYNIKARVLECISYFLSISYWNNATIRILSIWSMYIYRTDKTPVMFEENDP